MTGRRFGGARLRVLTAVVTLPLLLVLSWHPGLALGFAILVAALAAVGLYEYYAIVRKLKVSPETIGGIIAGTGVALSGYWGSALHTNLLLYGSCLMVATLHLVRGQQSVTGMASSLFGVFYVGWFASHINALRVVEPTGTGLVTILFVATMLTDSAAYLVGSTLGRTKMAPNISPNKSWEGAAGGFGFALAGMAALYYGRDMWEWPVLPDWSLARYLFAGALLSVTGQIGDLAESCLKRDAGIKDSGAFFPGHGGVLDRCDGILFAAPILYYIVAL